MTQAIPSIAASTAEIGDHWHTPDRAQQVHELRTELAELQPLVSAAVLTATAFRMRDHEALISALRLLVRCVRLVEERRACA